MSFRPATLENQSIPNPVELALAAGEDFEAGALLLVDGSGDFAECGADPATIAAVSLTGAGTEPGDFRMVSNREFPPGVIQGIPLLEGRRFSAEFLGSLPSQIGGLFGVAEDSDGQWKVDFGETVNTRCTLVGIDQGEGPLPGPSRVIVTFLEANIGAV